MTKACNRCGEAKPLAEFPQNGKGTIRPDCKRCHSARVNAYSATRKDAKRLYNAKYYAENKEWLTKAMRRRNKITRYGITPEQWVAMLDSQGGVCAACGTDVPHTAKGWHTDHCHETGKVRGILCANCNSALGFLGDSPERILALYVYLTGQMPVEVA